MSIWLAEFAAILDHQNRTKPLSAKSAWSSGEDSRQPLRRWANETLNRKLNLYCLQRGLTVPLQHWNFDRPEIEQEAPRHLQKIPQSEQLWIKS
jgi:hypothetical protein